MVKKSPTAVIIETGGIGFQIWIPLSSYKTLGEVGGEVKILTHLHVREDVLQLFGFATLEEKQLFQLLISVSGVGPKLAQGILSGISVGDFEQAIRSEDLPALTRISGLGKKTAERLVLELREKIGEGKLDHEGVPSAVMSAAGEEAILALTSLGYRKMKAQEVVQNILKKEASLQVEEILRKALQKL